MFYQFRSLLSHVDSLEIKVSLNFTSLSNTSHPTPCYHPSHCSYCSHAIHCIHPNHPVIQVNTVISVTHY